MKQGRKLANNDVKKIREKLLMSKAELAREAVVSNFNLGKIKIRKICRICRQTHLSSGYQSHG